MIWDLLQQQQIINLDNQIKRTRESSLQHIERITNSVDDRLSRLTLVCEAMWLLLKERTDLTEEDLIRKVTELDLKDGVLDGKLNRNVARGQMEKCPECGAAISKKFNRCLFCGNQPEGNAAPFDTLG